MSQIFVFNSANYDAGDAFPRYRELYARGADVERTSDPFFARVRSWRLDRTLLFAREYGGVRHHRRERVSSDGFDHFVLHYVVSGELLAGSDGAPVPVAPGEILMLDTLKAMESAAQAVELITVSVARDAVLAAAGNLDNLHGHRIGALQGGLLGALLRALVEQTPHLPTGAQAAVTRTLVDLLSVAINPGGAGARSDFYRLEYVRREAVQRLIEARLGERDFSVKDIVSATGIARASLYRLFEAQGGVVKFMQQRRLQHLRERLDNRAFDSHPLAELAPQSGFAGESHASRLFKQAFGVAPGAYRAACMRSTKTPSIDLMTRRWNSALGELS